MSFNTAAALRKPDDEPNPETETFLSLHVRLADGVRVTVDAADGFKVVELIRAGGLPIKAECGGSAVCATCHVRVPEEWRSRLPAPGEDELDRLDEIADADESSRLACQIEMTAALDGLELTIDAGSISQPKLRKTG